MIRKEFENSSDICMTLFYRLYDQGLSVSEVHKLIQDVFNLIKNGGSFTLDYINFRLEQMGWDKMIMDTISFELLLDLVESELPYQVKSHAIH